MSMRNIFRKIAKENRLSVKEVKDEMQNVLEYAYQSTTKMVLYLQDKMLYQEKIKFLPLKNS